MVPALIISGTAILEKTAHSARLDPEQAPKIAQAYTVATASPPGTSRTRPAPVIGIPRQIGIVGQYPISRKRGRPKSVKWRSENRPQRDKLETSEARKTFSTRQCDDPHCIGDGNPDEMSTTNRTHPRIPTYN